MIRQIELGNRAATLTVVGSELRYVREDGVSFRGTFSLESGAGGRYSVLIDGRSFLVTLGPKGNVSVNGESFSIAVFDPRDRPSRTASGRDHGNASVVSPMPGKVIRVLIGAGDSVEQGQGLVVVEAMKMQNEMKSPKSGRIMEIRTEAGATVTAGQVLVIVE